MHCDLCSVGRYAQCLNYNYLGSRCDGAFAEFVCAPVWNLLDVPDSLTFEEAAMVEPAAVAVHALRRGKLAVGDFVLIFGAGPIGLMLGFWARIMGASRILLTDIDDAKLALARKLHFEDLFNTRQGDPIAWVYDLTGHGADLVVEGSGSSTALEQCPLSARIGGRIVLMGNPLSGMGMSQKAYWEILRKELAIYGTWNSSCCDMPHNERKLALKAMTEGRLDVQPLITHRTDLEGLRAALVMMRNRTAFFNKVMFCDMSP
jgi:L-iditol 2-dehydrogenase